MNKQTIDHWAQTWLPSWRDPRDTGSIATASANVESPDEHFEFDPLATRAILAGFAFNRPTYLFGPPGCGKSSHIEQIAGRLGWAWERINLDAHLTRADFVGRDQVRIRDGLQVTEFVPGLLIAAMQRPCALILDEYDAGRPDVLFLLQRVLESRGRFTLLEENRVIIPHPEFRLFATANTAGGGDMLGVYAGTQILNQAQLDRWQMVVEMHYPSRESSRRILLAQFPDLEPAVLEGMLNVADLCREALQQSELTLNVSIRTLLHWAGNSLALGSAADGFRLAYWHRCESHERALVETIYQRCFATDLIVHNPPATAG